MRKNRKDNYSRRLRVVRHASGMMTVARISFADLTLLLSLAAERLLEIRADGKKTWLEGVERLPPEHHEDLRARYAEDCAIHARINDVIRWLQLLTYNTVASDTSAYEGPIKQLLRMRQRSRRMMAAVQGAIDALPPGFRIKP